LSTRGFGRREDDPRQRAVSACRELGELLQQRARGRASARPAPGRPAELAPAHGTTRPAAGELPPDGAAGLQRLIEGEILPRLLQRHDRRPPPRAAARITAADHVRFLEALRSSSAAAAQHVVGELIAGGVHRELVLLDLLANAARRLGELWEADLCDFVEVTIGLCRLHQLVREAEPLQRADPPGAAADAPSVLLATACADAHVFGVAIVADFFRRDGWRVWSAPGARRDELAAMLAAARIDVLGLSAARDAPGAELATEIDVLRRVSRNTGLCVLVGGRRFEQDAHLAQRIGADAIAHDASRAPAAARALLRRPRQSS